MARHAVFTHTCSDSILAFTSLPELGGTTQTFLRAGVYRWWMVKSDSDWNWPL